MVTNTTRSILPLHSLTGLCGLGAVYLFAFHYAQYGCSDVLAPLANNGRVVISLAFVLSGFTMTYKYGHCEMDLDNPCRQYLWLRRWFRLMPCYLLALVINLNDFRCTVSNSSDDNEIDTTGTNACTRRQWFDLILQIFGVSSWLPRYDPDDGDTWPSWHLVSWAVQTELGFCLLFPFLLSMHRYVTTKRGWRGWIELLISYSFLSWFIPLTIAAPSSSYKFQSLAARCPEFALGMLFAPLHKSIEAEFASQQQGAAGANSANTHPSIHRVHVHPSPPATQHDAITARHTPSTIQQQNPELIQHIPLSFIYLFQCLQQRCDWIFLMSVIGIFAAGFDDTLTDWCALGGTAQLLVVVIFALAGCETSSDSTHSRFVVRFLSSSLIENMGKISYCFFLVHLTWPPLLLWLRNHVSSSSDQDAPTSYFASPFFIFSIIAAVIMYRVIETPLLIASKNWLTRRNVNCHCSNRGIQSMHIHYQTEQGRIASSADATARVEEIAIPYQEGLDEDILLHVVTPR